MEIRGCLQDDTLVRGRGIGQTSVEVLFSLEFSTTTVGRIRSGAKIMLAAIESAVSIIEIDRILLTDIAHRDIQRAVTIHITQP
jgi:hypothetical protein